jgi:hypothetical protein
MPIYDWQLPNLYTHVDRNIRCEVTKLPSGALLSAGLLMVKRLVTDSDNNALISKRITPTLQPNIGHITEPGASLPAVGIFNLNPSDLSLLNPNLSYVAEIKFITNGGEVLLFARSLNVRVKQSIVQTVE